MTDQTQTSQNNVQIPSPADATKGAEGRAKFTEEAHQYIRDFIRQADQKAAFFFAGSTALFAYLVNGHFIEFSRWQRPCVDWSFVDVLSLLTTLALVIAAAFCLITVAPRLKGSKRGLIYFGAIAEFDSGLEYANDIRNRPLDELIEAKLIHVHAIAGICAKKFKMLTFGVYAGGIRTDKAKRHQKKERIATSVI